MLWPWEEGAIWVVDPELAFLIVMGSIGITASLIGWWHEERYQRQSHYGMNYAPKRKRRVFGRFLRRSVKEADTR